MNVDFVHTADPCCTFDFFYKFCLVFEALIHYLMSMEDLKTNDTTR